MPGGRRKEECQVNYFSRDTTRFVAPRQAKLGLVQPNLGLAQANFAYAQSNLNFTQPLLHFPGVKLPKVRLLTPPITKK